MSTFICEKCGSTSYEQLTQTQVICTKCKNVSFFDTGYRVPKQFETTREPASHAINKPVFRRAPLAKRFVNYLVDTFAIIFIVVVISSLLGISIEMNAAEMMKPGYVLKPQDIHVLSLLLAVFLVYYIVSESLFGKTLGKFVTRTSVISADGSKASLGQCIGRAFCRILPFERFSGFFMNGVFWHDAIPKTIVTEDL